MVLMTNLFQILLNFQLNCKFLFVYIHSHNFKLGKIKINLQILEFLSLRKKNEPQQNQPWKLLIICNAQVRIQFNDYLFLMVFDLFMILTLPKNSTEKWSRFIKEHLLSIIQPFTMGSLKSLSEGKQLYGNRGIRSLGKVLI